MTLENIRSHLDGYSHTPSHIKSSVRPLTFPTVTLRLVKNSKIFLLYQSPILAYILYVVFTLNLHLIQICNVLQSGCIKSMLCSVCRCDEHQTPCIQMLLRMSQGSIQQLLSIFSDLFKCFCVKKIITLEDIVLNVMKKLTEMSSCQTELSISGAK